MGRRGGRVDAGDRQIHGLHPGPRGRRSHPGRGDAEGTCRRIGGRQVLPRGRGGAPQRGSPEERRDAARDEGGRPLGLAARLPRVRGAHHGRVDPPEAFPNAVSMKKFTTKAQRTQRILFFVLFVPLWCLSAPALQDEGQRNTALLGWYPEVGELQKKASGLAAAGRYVEALAIFDEALEKRPNTVVPVDDGQTLNLGLREYILRQIAAWPEEGKAAYRRRADPLADHLFQGAKRNRDVDELERVVDLYPFSSVVDDALTLIANIRLDAGDHGGAAEALGRLLDREGAGDRSVVIARLGLAWARGGRKAPILELIKRVERDAPGSKVHVGGNEVSVADYLKRLADGVLEQTVDAAPLALPAWDTISGGAAGTRLAESGVELAKAAWVDVVGLPRLDGEDEFVVRRSMTL